MANNLKADFFIRPGYGSAFNLIEFTGQDVSLFRERLDALLKDLSAEPDDQFEYSYINDEIMQFKSAIGSFSVSIDFNCLIFMHSGAVHVENSESNEVIEKLAEALVRHNFKQLYLTDEELAEYKVEIKSGL